MKRNLELVVQRHVRGTPKKGYVKNLRVKVCELPNKLKGKLKIKDTRVYITTKALKHLYDVRLAEEFDFIIKNVDSFVINPLRVYQNKEGKTGDFCLYHEAGDSAYFCILQVNLNVNYIVSVFRLSDVESKRRHYLDGYNLLWSWKGD